ncbi:sigma-70 family RNA polymerase sigma factor [bacterium]|nr:sigma-70 family RNA polymerase sigma factor [bacterium]
MLQETYISLISGRNRFRGEAKLSTFVYHVTRIMILQKFRRENTLKSGKIYRRIEESFDTEASNRCNPEYRYEVGARKSLLLERLSRLPALYQEAVRLKFIEGLTCKEISGRLAIPANTVATKIHRGKQVLAILLRNEERCTCDWLQNF